MSEREKPSPKWMEPNKDRVRRSKKHENRLAGRLGGRRLPASGALPMTPLKKGSEGGDISLKEFFVEHKRTEYKSMSLKLDWLEGIVAAAAKHQKDPALIMTFERGVKGAPSDWVLVPIHIFEHLRNMAKED